MWWKDRVDLLRRAFDAMVEDPGFRAEVARRKVDLGPLPGEALQAMIAQTLDVPKSVIQRAIERSLAKKTKLKDVLDVVRQFRVTDQKTPIVLMGYLNPVECMGYKEFAGAAVEAGVDGAVGIVFAQPFGADGDVRAEQRARPLNPHRARSHRWQAAA